MTHENETTSPLEVLREDDGHSGRYVVRLGDGTEAEMTYWRAAKDKFVFDHTLVPAVFRGRGVAAKMMHQAIADARREGFKIVPGCSYVAAQFRRHPEWSDLRTA